MKLNSLFLPVFGCSIALSTICSAQLIAPSVFLQGAFVEVGVAQNGAFGAGAVPATYHPQTLGTPGTNIAVVYDFGHDGWAVGTPGFYGDYIFPGTPFEGWSVQVAGNRSDAFYSSGPASFGGPGGLTGSNISYTYTPPSGTCGYPIEQGSVSGLWRGTMTSGGGGLQIRQTTTVDTMASWVMVTTVFTNGGATTLPGLYYHRTCDPDNDVTHSSNFSTINIITKQNDEVHRVMAGSYGFALYHDAYLALATKDCRAKCLIYQSWPPPAGVANNLDLIWSGTATGIGTTWYGVGQTTVNQDIAIGLVYNLGDLAPGDSTMICYAYIMKDSLAIDSVFREPQLVVNCVPAAPSGPAPAPTYDTFSACDHPGIPILPVYIKYGGERNWSWSKWNWAPTIGLSSATGLTNNINIAALPGPTTYTITGTDSATGMYSCANRTFYLTVLPCFNATSNSPDTQRICVDDTLRLYAHGDSLGATYLWYGPGITGPLRGTTQYIKVPHVIMADTGWYYVIKNVGTESDTTRTHVLFKPKPIIAATYNPPVCSGTTLFLYSNPDSVGETWVWRGPVGFGSILSDPNRPTAPTSFSGVYTVIATFRGCVDSATVNVTIDSTPAVPTIGSNTPVCEADTLFLTSSTTTPGVTYNWAGPSGYTSTAQNPIRPNPPLTASGTYTVTVTLGACSSSATTVVEIRPTPIPILGSNSPVCSGNALNLTATGVGGTTYSWTGPNGFSAAVQNPVINPAITASGGVYSLIATLNGCASAITTINVVVDTTPTLLVFETNSPGPPGATICEGDTLTFLSLSSTAGVTYTWTGPNSFASTQQNPFILGATPLATGTYTLVVAIGSCSVSAVLNATVTATPPISITSNSPVCTGAGDTLMLHAASNPAAIFTWSGPYTFSSGAQDPFRTPVVIEYAGTYHVDVLSDGCTNHASHTVIVNPTPTPPWIKWLTYCQHYDAPYLQAGGSNILWYTSSAPGSIGTSMPPKPQTDVVGYMFYYVNQTLANCPSAIDSIRVVVNPRPTVTVSEGATVCPHDTVALIAVNTDPIAYFNWYPYMYLNDTIGPKVTARPETDMVYTVVTKNMYGCTDTGTINLKVKASAVIFLEDSVTLFPGETFQIEPQSNCSIHSWTPAGGLSSKYVVNPIASPEISTKYVITGITEWGCKTKDSINIYIAEDAVITIPNAFAPGSINSKFKAVRRGIAKLDHFRIYDRWGVVVYNSTNIDEGWDGTYKGVPQPVGVYVYDVAVITKTGKIVSKTGNVTLLR